MANYLERSPARKMEIYCAQAQLTQIQNEFLDENWYMYYIPLTIPHLIQMPL